MGTELTQSRRQHYTIDGQEITQVIQATWEEFDNPVAAGLPRIGQYWSRFQKNLTVVDIDIKPVPDNNTHAIGTFTYSTSGQFWPENIPDTVASVKQAFDFQIVPGISDSYFDYGTDANESWTNIYTTYFESLPAGTPPNAIPPRVRESSTIVMTIKGNVRFWNWSDVSAALGTVNSDTFLPLYTERYVIDINTGLNKWVESIRMSHPFVDVGQWLFAGFHCENIGRSSGFSAHPNYEITSTFLWEREGWNSIYGVTGYQAYRITNFFVLPRPISHSVSIDMGGR